MPPRTGRPGLGSGSLPGPAAVPCAPGPLVERRDRNGHSAQLKVTQVGQ